MPRAPSRGARTGLRLWPRQRWHALHTSLLFIRTLTLPVSPQSSASWHPKEWRLEKHLHCCCLWTIPMTSTIWWSLPLVLPGSTFACWGTQFISAILSLMGQSGSGTQAPYGLQKGEVLGTGCVTQGLEKQLGAAQLQREQIVEGKKHKGLMKGAPWAVPEQDFRTEKGQENGVHPGMGKNLSTDTGAKPSAAGVVALWLRPSTQQQTLCLPFDDWKKVRHVQWQKSPLCAFLKH